MAEIERVAAGGFRAILLPATPPMPYYSRDFDPVWAAAQANGVHVFIHTQTGGVKVNDPEAVTLKVVMENAAQVNQPVTEKSASKRMVTQAIYSTIVPQQVICQLIGGGVPERYPDLHFALSSSTPTGSARWWAAWTSAGSPGSARTPTGGWESGTTRSRHPAGQHGPAVQAEREVAVPVDAERVRPAPVPRLVPGRPGGGGLPEHHRTVDDRVGNDYPHAEGTFRGSRELMGKLFADVPATSERPWWAAPWPGSSVSTPGWQPPPAARPTGPPRQRTAPALPARRGAAPRAPMMGLHSDSTNRRQRKTVWW